MCFMISIISLILSYKLFVNSNISLSILSLSVALFFIYLMIRNIIYIKKNKE
jgi:hypothetical protein